MVQVLEEEGRRKRHPPQPISGKNSNMSLQILICTLLIFVLRLHSPVKGWKWYNHLLELFPATLLSCLIHYLPGIIVVIQKCLQEM